MPTTPTTTSGPFAPAEIPKSPAITLDRYGAPTNYSAEHEIPRPPIVLRLLDYRAEQEQLF